MSLSSLILPCFWHVRQSAGLSILLALLIKICPLFVVVVVIVIFLVIVICPPVCKLFRGYLLQNYTADINQTWQKAALGEGNLSVFFNDGSRPLKSGNDLESLEKLMVILKNLLFNFSKKPSARKARYVLKHPREMYIWFSQTLFPLGKNEPHLGNEVLQKEYMKKIFKSIFLKNSSTGKAQSCIEESILSLC